jgi:tRNA 2-thiouridine synthesizing protein A
MTEDVSTNIPSSEEEVEGAAADPTPALELDCRGLNCPLPILKTKKAIDTIEVGQILKMISTDPGSVPDVAAFSRRTGHEVVQQSEGDGEYLFWIRRV